MSTPEKYLTYRGDLRALSTSGAGLAFVTVHPEKRATAVYKLDVEKFELAAVELPVGGQCLAASAGDLWIGGDDGRLYKVSAKAKAAQALPPQLDQPATHLAPLSRDRLAALCGQQLLVLDRDGKLLQTIELSEKGTALAADPTGEWLVVGGNKGLASVFECEDKADFQPAEAAKLHEGAVTALLFEPEELRFLSAGADLKLLLTHARGKLEPEDRGRDANHKDQVTAIVHAPGERFITGSRDQSCKTWTRAGATRPATLSDGVPAVVGLAIVEIHERPHLVVAGQDNSLRFFLIDAGGKFGAATQRLYDAYDRAAFLLGQSEPSARGEALHALAEYDDQRSLEAMAHWIEKEPDHALRLRATELLSKSRHPRAAKLLEPLLAHDDGAVRLAALAGLRAFAGKENLRPLELALDAGAADLGVAAVAGLESLAKKDEQARRLLIQALDATQSEVRRAALLGLESVFAKHSPEPTLIASQAGQVETRRLALVRAMQRGLLDDARIAGVLRRRGEDPDADVRHTAFLVSLLSREKLAKALRERDKDLHRQLFELETFAIEPKPGAAAQEPPKVTAGKFKLESDDFQPLLSAISSRAVDTCLSGARCLALLGDARAFGLLLQLSRENLPAARVQVCQALAALADARALQRLESMIDDDAAEVRDAAYSALVKIREADPLAAAQAGLASKHADVRRRGLQTLVATQRKTAKGKETANAPAAALVRTLLLRALNDPDSSVSGEGFKAALNLQIAGDNVETLQFVLGSVHASVRREVLTEAMAQDAEPWAWKLLLELLSDPDPQIRLDAYEHALKKTKSRDVAPMQAALASRYVDVRKRAVESLIKLGNEAAQTALAAAVDDADEEVRTLALRSLLAQNSEVLAKALESRYLDVRLLAASAGAFMHHPAAREPLLAAASEPRPEKNDDRKLWAKNVLIALTGLGVLGDPQCVERLLPLLQYAESELRKATAEALVWCAAPSNVEALKGQLQHSDEQVKFRIALALMLCGDEIAGTLVFSPAAAKALTEKDLLLAAAVSGPAGEIRLAGLLDSGTSWVRQAAFLTLLARDWRAHAGTPSRLLAALAAQNPRIRLAAARGIEAFADPAAFAHYLLEFVNDRGGSKPWTISAETWTDFANLLVFAPPPCQARTLALCEHLASANEQDQEAWDFRWRLHAQRYQAELAAARKSPAPPQVSASAADLEQLAFGTLVGLVREQGSYHLRGAVPSFEVPVNVIRQAAIRLLVARAKSSAEALAATLPVLIQTLSDRLQDVRTLAFEQLGELGMPPADRAAAGLECGHNDLAVAALKLLTAGAGAKGQAILAEVITSRADALAIEAAKLLIEAIGIVKAADSGLESPNEHVRRWVVSLLASAGGAASDIGVASATGATGDQAAAQRLKSALASRHLDVRQAAAIALAMQKDPAAFDALSKLLFETEADQHGVIAAISILGDPRGGALLLNRLENDADKTANANWILSAVGELRNLADAPKLLAMLERDAWRNDALAALLSISGYDQDIEDPQDERTDRGWLTHQRPRHDDVLADVMERLRELGRPQEITRLIAGARWSPTAAVDPVLATLAAHPDDRLRHSVIEAIGWRLKKRKGSPAPLLSALEHRDPQTRFIAAEGLARSGRAEGINILLSAIELLSDLNLRRRAVLAVGELADQRAMEVLLKLASDDVHALQDVAAEAIGHLGQSDKADKILELLLRLAKSTGSVALPAVVGLRWLNLPKGWDLLRAMARDPAMSGTAMECLVEQLGYNDNPATRDLLLEILAGSEFIETALPAARRLFGMDSLEPDYAVMRAQYEDGLDDDIEREHGCLRRVCERGDPARIFELLPQVRARFDDLAFHLLHLQPLPEGPAAAALTSPHAGAVEVAAGVIGRTGARSHAKAVTAALTHWLGEWTKHFADHRRGSSFDKAQMRDATERLVQALFGGRAEPDPGDDDDDDLAAMGRAGQPTRTLLRLCWAAGRLGAGKAELLELIGSHRDARQFTPVRVAALAALGQLKLTKGDLAVVAQSLTDADGAVRKQAAAALAAHDPGAAAQAAEQALSDRPVFQQLTARAPSPAALAAGVLRAHSQPVVLPQVLAAKDVRTLSAAALDRELSEAARLGAIEALARLGLPQADETLARIGKNAGEEEELRKAAWRGLRRSKRQQVKP